MNGINRIFHEGNEGNEEDLIGDEVELVPTRK